MRVDMVCMACMPCVSTCMRRHACQPCQVSAGQLAGVLWPGWLAGLTGRAGWPGWLAGLAGRVGWLICWLAELACGLHGLASLGSMRVMRVDPVLTFPSKARFGV